MIPTVLIVAASIAVAAFATLVVGGLVRGDQTHRVLVDAACRSATFFGCFVGGYVLGTVGIWSVDKVLMGASALGVIHLAAATAIGLAVVGVYLSMGRTRWRSALCGAGTVACFLTVLALVHGAGV